MCVSAIGAVFGAVGAIAQGMAQASAYKAEAKAAKLEARMQREAGAYEASRMREKGERIVGDQVAAYSAEGLAVTEGSPLDVIVDTQTEINLDKAAIAVNAENRAKTLDYKAKIAKMNAGNAMIGGVIGAAQAIVGAVPSGSFTQQSQGQAPTLAAPSYRFAPMGRGQGYI